MMVISFGIALFPAMTGAAIHNYAEDFTTTQFKDALNTTAWWDTIAGELKLDFHPLSVVGSYPSGSILDISIAADVMFVTDLTSGVKSLDISDPTNPLLMDTYYSPFDCIAIEISGDYAYVAGAN